MIADNVYILLYGLEYNSIYELFNIRIINKEISNILKTDKYYKRLLCAEILTNNLRSYVKHKCINIRKKEFVFIKRLHNNKHYPSISFFGEYNLSLYGTKLRLYNNTGGKQRISKYMNYLNFNYFLNLMYLSMNMYHFMDLQHEIKNEKDIKYYFKYPSYNFKLQYTGEKVKTLKKAKSFLKHISIKENNAYIFSSPVYGELKYMFKNHYILNRYGIDLNKNRSLNSILLI